HRAQLGDHSFFGADVTLISNGIKGNDLHLITLGPGRSCPWRADEEPNSNLRTEIATQPTFDGYCDVTRSSSSNSGTHMQRNAKDFSMVNSRELSECKK
ncbi:hypothetical protein KIN20_025922, partial [Parelaphostrongylus tenuis]